MHRATRPVLLALVLTSLVPASAFPVDIGTLHCNDANGVPTQLNQTVTVRGIVTGNWPTATATRLWIQDATGGINIFGSPQLCSAMGVDLEITGTVQQFNGLAEVQITSSTTHSSGNPQPTPLVLTMPQMNGTYDSGTNCEPNESKLIRINNGFVRTSSGGMPVAGALYAANTNYQLRNAGPDSATNFVIMRIVQTTNGCPIVNPIVDTPINRGCPTDVVGVLSQFDSTQPHTEGYQLQPRLVSDIMPMCEVPTVPSTWGKLKTTHR
jgi:hypothetical protein